MFDDIDKLLSELASSKPPVPDHRHHRLNKRRIDDRRAVANDPAELLGHTEPAVMMEEGSKPKPAEQADGVNIPSATQQPRQLPMFWARFQKVPAEIRIDILGYTASFRFQSIPVDKAFDASSLERFLMKGSPHIPACFKSDIYHAALKDASFSFVLNEAGRFNSTALSLPPFLSDKAHMVQHLTIDVNFKLTEENFYAADIYLAQRLLPQVTSSFPKLKTTTLLVKYNECRAARERDIHKVLAKTCYKASSGYSTYQIELAHLLACFIRNGPPGHREVGFVVTIPGEQALFSLDQKEQVISSNLVDVRECLAAAAKAEKPVGLEMLEQITRGRIAQGWKFWHRVQ